MNTDNDALRFWIESRAQDMLDRGWDRDLLIETLDRISQYPEMQFQPIGNLLNVLRVVMVERSMALSEYDEDQDRRAV